MTVSTLEDERHRSREVVPLLDFVAKRFANRHVAPGRESAKDQQVGDIRHAEQHYRREDGTPTSEPVDFKAALKPLKELYGTLAVCNFGPLKLRPFAST